MFRTAVILATAVTLGLPVSGMAQSQKSADPVAEALRDTERQSPAEQRVTRALNAEILEQNDLAEMEDRANQAKYDKARAEYETELARVDAETARIAREDREAQERYQAQLAAHARARADWEACVAGNRARCAPE